MYKGNNMKAWFVGFSIIALTCLLNFQLEAQDMNNPFFSEWKTPFKTPPFDKIKHAHYLPAFEKGIQEHAKEVDEVIKNSAKPTFKNTIEPLEKSGELLNNVNRIFGAMSSANTDDEMQTIAEKTASMLSKHNDDIYLNSKLFAKVKAIHDSKEAKKLTPEQKVVLENYYLDFVLGGANLDDKGKDELRKINDELAQLVLKFGDNVRKENSKFELVVDTKAALAGLSDAFVQEAAEKAKAKGLSGKWLFTIDKPTLLPFLTYSAKRDLREKMYKAYMGRGNNNDSLDNKAIFSRIVVLRVKKANLLGYKRFSDLALQRKMAKTPENVYKFLSDVWKPTVHTAQKEVEEMQKLINEEGGNFKLQPWDWWYYAEKVKQKKYALDEDMLRPYFKLENVIQGAFAVAHKLYGVNFAERKDIQIYHPDVKVFEVTEASGKHLGILYTDYFPRESKANGAWCGSFRDESNLGGKFVTPLVYNVGNFSKPTSDKPALLSVDEVETLFHEFGHGLHALFQHITYPGAGVVPTDFVELPSQIMEKWAMEPEVLALYAKHYKTGEIIPAELVKKIENASHFNQGFETLEYMAASILDMDWHSVTDTMPRDVEKFEKESIAKMGLIPEIWPRYMTTNFIHIATWGYESGYYSYLWSAILDAAAFEAFAEKGLFDQATALSFRKNILEKSGSEDFMKIYKNFRGREPKVEALLKKRGLN